MSNYGDQFQDADLERQIQEEYRRRQQVLQGGASAGGVVNAQQLNARPPDAYSQHHLMMQQQQQHNGAPYSAYQQGAGVAGSAAGRGAHTSPYSHMTNPYGAADGRFGQGGTPNSTSDTAAAQLYAAQQQQQQHRRAQMAGQYGYAGAAQSRAALEQHYAAYGMGMPAQYDYAAQQEQHQQQMQAHYGAHSQQQQPHPQQSGSGGTPMGDTPKLDAASEPKKKKPKKEKAKKPMLQKVTSTISKPKNTARLVVKDGLTTIEDGNDLWYTGCVALGVEDDKYWLSELQVYLRSDFAEAFGATEEDIAAPMHGRNKPIALGQVGIRCMHCKQDNPAERGQQATSYPSLISGIYNSVQQMLRLHLECCLSMPPEVRSKIEQLKVSCSSRGGRKQYWIDSARRLGLTDTPHGIHFGRNPQGPLPPLTGPSVNSKEGRSKKKQPPKSTPMPAKEEAAEAAERMIPPPPVDNRPLVFHEDKALISDYLYVTLEQMSPCVLMEADRVGCYKTRKVGFPGLACKHCVGQAGCGRYFPASEASLSQTTTSQTIMNHVRNCRRCPIEIRENLELMKRNRMGPDGKRSDKPKHGGRKVFFHRLWCRIQNVPIDEGKVKAREKKRIAKKASSKKRKKREDSEAESDGDPEDEGSDGDSESEVSDDSEDEAHLKPKSKRKSAGNSAQKKKVSPWFDGCVRLTKADDSQWLSDMECFARSDLVEAFALRDEGLEGYGGRKIPATGQVGIRCVFCKSLDPEERPNNCITFPESVSGVHTKVTDMIRLHFPNCPSMPDEERSTFKSKKGFDAKMANDDSQQYWVDSARDLGLANLPPDPNKGWGITFRCDPIQPSPADELDLEKSNDTAFEFGKNSLVRQEDTAECTDQVMLLLRQVRPCRFKKSDRRAGPGSRGRDRSMGFPGMCCLHCVGRNTIGRYFPVSPKNLTDSTANSLLAHVASCTHCPEPIKASLAYLGHRSILQKAEMSGSWKKSFFKKVWDRLHVERGWSSIDDEEGAEKLDDSSADENDDDDDENDNDEDEGDGEGEGESGTQSMSALIQAAAIWLTNQDAATDGPKSGSRSGKVRGATPAKGSSASKKKSEPEAVTSTRETRSLPTSGKRRSTRK